MTSDATLGGEPAHVESIEAYEYPAQGGEWVPCVAAMHRGRPYVIRVWSPGADLDELADILEGFVFLGE
jgi:hypothetical protein